MCRRSSRVPSVAAVAEALRVASIVSSLEPAESESRSSHRPCRQRRSPPRCGSCVASAFVRSVPAADNIQRRRYCGVAAALLASPAGARPLEELGRGGCHVADAVRSGGRSAVRAVRGSSRSELCAAGLFPIRRSDARWGVSSWSRV
ncbi:hypothetical protein Esi_0039_0122 [Ectocarpus siliculosus]|uniref:Uncharacterized protein n=1 Tax=Ectocarpus siliculosus TaxID=2880 RepID=D7G009_ECTSI|nr:hypothetical protein Esi_0039_0122 [Ectocarpus siliculosus]|eukprot:CBJ48634.1 hypothetical protein Esi_0039_0122 [Ectocarpus siliculosus]